MPALYLIWAFFLVFSAPAEARQAAPADASSTGYVVFLRGTAIGRETLTISQDATGITLAGQGRLVEPLNVLVRRAEVRYRRDWTPESLTVDASIGGQETVYKTTFSNRSADTEGRLAGQQVTQSEATFGQPMVLPGTFFGAYAAIAMRLATAADPTVAYQVFFGPQIPPAIFRASPATSERMQTGTTTFTVRRYDLSFASSAGGENAEVNLFADDRGALVRVSVPARGIEVIREDVSSPTARTDVYSNPGDEAVVVPAAGFNIGATLTRPQPAGGTPAPTRLPAVILVQDTGSGDRDGVLSGIPTTGQLAGAIARAGFLAVRFDKRGYGQSGGRAESATFNDHAEDVRAVYRWLRSRPDVDRDRIAVVGHGEGGWLALLAASREGGLAAAGVLAAPSTTGQEVVLEQQRYALAQGNVPEAERTERIALQQRINAAVVSGRGWEGVSPEVRKQADTPWFQSLLTYDPARVLNDVRQPVLLVHGDVDQQVPVSHVDRLAQLAQRRSRAVDVVTVRGVNHLLVPATTGHVAEYPSLRDRSLSQDVLNAVTAWLAKTFKATN